MRVGISRSIAIARANARTIRDELAAGTLNLETLAPASIAAFEHLAKTLEAIGRIDNLPVKNEYGLNGRQIRGVSHSALDLEITNIARSLIVISLPRSVANTGEGDPSNE